MDLGLSQEALGQRVSAGQTAVAAWETGRNVPKDQRIIKLARALSVSEQYLRYGRDGSETEKVPMRGYVGGGGKVSVLPNDVLESVEAPPGSRGAIEALEIRGGAVPPVYRPGDRIFYEIDADYEPAALVDEECVIEIDSGEVYLAFLYPGSEPGTFTLKPHSGPAVHNQVIVRCAPVVWIQRHRTIRHR